jgi:hypothetical protein
LAGPWCCAGSGHGLGVAERRSRNHLAAYALSCANARKWIKGKAEWVKK